MCTTCIPVPERPPVQGTNVENAPAAVNPTSFSDFRTDDHIEGGAIMALRSAAQERVVEAALRRPVVDRVGLIIRVFAQRAATREARLQVGWGAGQDVLVTRVKR